MYTVAITATGQTCKGKALPVGHKITNSQAYRHCLPGFRNRKPIAEPVDDVTREKVALELRKHDGNVAARKPVLQRDIDRLAAKLPTDDQGQFVRDDATGTVKKASRVDQITIDSAAAYGINPTPPADEAAVELSTGLVDPSPLAAAASQLLHSVPVAPPTLEDITAAVEDEADADEVAAEVPDTEQPETVSAAPVMSAYSLPE